MVRLDTGCTCTLEFGLVLVRRRVKLGLDQASDGDELSLLIEFEFGVDIPIDCGPISKG